MITAGLIIGAGFLSAHMATVGLVARRLAQPAKRGIGIGRAKITLLRPVCGLDALDEITLASSFQQDWPDYEVIFCAPSADDAAVPVIRALIAAHPHVQAQLLVGQQRRTGNPKLDNLWKGWEAASADWICMADANLLLPPDYLTRVAQTWDGDTGLVTSPPFGSDPDGFAGHLEAAFLNASQARLQLAIDELGQGYAQGKTLFWNRAMLDQAGGLMALGRWLAEDVASTKLVRALGRKVRLVQAPFAQPIGKRSFRAVWDRQLRWSRVRRDGFPLLFLFEIGNGSVLPAIATLIGGGLPALALFLTLWFGAEAWLCRRAGWPMGARDLAMSVLRDLMMPAIWVATFARRGIEWRGKTMDAPPRASGERAKV